MRLPGEFCESDEDSSEGIVSTEKESTQNSNPLHVAASKGDIALMVELISKGHDINERYKSNNSSDRPIMLYTRPAVRGADGRIYQDESGLINTDAPPSKDKLHEADSANETSIQFPKLKNVINKPSVGMIPMSEEEQKDFARLQEQLDAPLTHARNTNNDLNLGRVRVANSTAGGVSNVVSESGVISESGFVSEGGFVPHRRGRNNDNNYYPPSEEETSDAELFVEGETPLMTACRHGQLEAVKFLLGRQANTDYMDSRENTVLHAAASVKTDNVELLKILHNANQKLTHFPNLSGKTPVMLACLSGNFEAVKLLVDKGALLNVEDHGRCGVLHDAAKGGSVELMEWLIVEKQISYVPLNGLRESRFPSPLNLALRSNNIAVIECLITNGVGFKVSDISHPNLSKAHRVKLYQMCIAYEFKDDKGSIGRLKSMCLRQ